MLIRSHYIRLNDVRKLHNLTKAMFALSIEVCLIYIEQTLDYHMKEWACQMSKDLQNNFLKLFGNEILFCVTQKYFLNHSLKIICRRGWK